MLSLQFGAAIATNLFDEIGSAGASALRLGLAAVVLVAWSRPDVRSWSAEHRRSVVLLGLSMAVMNYAFYEAVSRIPLGAAITIEFLGPLGLAVALTRRWHELVFVALALAGVVILGLGQHGSVEGSLDPVGVAAALVAAAVLGRLHPGRIPAGDDRAGDRQPGGRLHGGGRRRGAHRRRRRAGPPCSTAASSCWAWPWRSWPRWCRTRSSSGPSSAWPSGPSASWWRSSRPSVRSWAWCCSTSTSARSRSWASPWWSPPGSAPPPPRRPDQPTLLPESS